MKIFLLVIFLVLLISIMLLVSLFKGVTSFIFGKSYSSPNFKTEKQNSDRETSSNFEQHNQRKVFSKEEGEYVKYEEIKE